jgi:hypothetical protein
MVPRQPFDQESESVSLQDGLNAREALGGRGRVDIDAYLSKLDVQGVLESPLGPTSDCLTLRQLEEYAFGAVTNLPHLATCESCANALRAYRAVKERSLEPGRQSIAVEVPGMIDLVRVQSQFHVMLLVDSILDIRPGDLTIANAAFKEIRCSAIEMVDSNPDRGWTYKAICVTQPNTELLSSCEPGVEFVDWIKVSGTSKAGRTFTASDLARFSVSQ